MSDSMAVALLPQRQQPPKTIIERLTETVSASRLNCWLQCRLKFYFRYVLDIRKKPTAALHVGKVVHKVLQSWNMARWRKEPFAIEGFQKIFDEDWNKRQEGSKVNWENGDDEKEQHDGAWSLLQVYFAETPIKSGEKPEAVEVAVEADVAGLARLVGILDLVRAGGRIVDFKTAGKTPDAERVVHMHEIQLSCYSVLYRDATGKRETTLELHHLVKLKKPKVVFTEFPPMSENQQSRLFRTIESYLKGVSRQDFVPSAGLQCVSCEYFNECRNWTGKDQRIPF